MDRPRDGTGRIRVRRPPRRSVPQGRVGAVDGRKPVDLMKGLSRPAVPRPLSRVRARLRGRRRLGPRPAQVTAHAGRRGGSVPRVSDGLSRSRSAPCSADGWDPGARKVRGSRGARQPPGPAPTGRRPVGTEESGPSSPRSLRCGSEASAGRSGLCALRCGCGCGCGARWAGAGGQRAAWLRARSAVRGRAAGTVRPGSAPAAPSGRRSRVGAGFPGSGCGHSGGQARGPGVGARRAVPAPQGGWGRRSERAGLPRRQGSSGRQQPWALIRGIRRAFPALLLSRCP